MPLPDGSIAAVKLDFEVIRRLGEVAREYGLAGAVQHGASTLPDELFHHFPAVETAEIHLATGFQNALYDNPAFPAALTKAIDGWCYSDAADERKPDQTDEQFVYTTRKKAIGPFKRELWDLPEKDEILADQATKIAFLFNELAVLGTREMVDRYIKPVVHRRACPRPRPNRTCGGLADGWQVPRALAIRTVDPASELRGPEARRTADGRLDEDRPGLPR